MERGAGETVGNKRGRRLRSGKELGKRWAEGDFRFYTIPQALRCSNL